jgi:hypothetical protein
MTTHLDALLAHAADRMARENFINFVRALDVRRDIYLLEGGFYEHGPACLALVDAQCEHVRSVTRGRWERGLADETLAPCYREKAARLLAEAAARTSARLSRAYHQHLCPHCGVTHECALRPCRYALDDGRAEVECFLCRPAAGEAGR